MGAFLMLASDLRIGVAGNWKIGMNETAIGLTVPHFALALARHRLTPPGFARITTAAMFAPEQALAAGYLDAVVQESQLRSAVADAAGSFRQLNAESYAGSKERINADVLRAVREGWQLDLQRPVGS
jgi:enoyl-CoA hydratase